MQRSGSETSVTLEEIPLGDHRLREFAAVPWRLYQGDPYWTPQLNADLLGSRVLGSKGLLTVAHPYHGWADVTHFMARRDGKPIGRVSAAINHRFNEYYDTRIGFFGFFECIEEYEVAEALLDAAREWIRGKGMAVMRGPGEYSNATHERQACLIDGFDSPPAMELTHNPPYYPEFFERYGLTKAKDYHAHILDLGEPIDPKLAQTAAKIADRHDIVTRMIDLKRFHEEVALVLHIYNEAWAKNWGFLPITEGEGEIIAEQLKVVCDPGLVRFAYVDDEPIAVLGAFPDPNYWLRPRWEWYGDSDPVRIARLLKGLKRIPRIRLMFFGIRPGWRRRGVDAVLYEQIHAHAIGHGYEHVDISLLLEDNDLVLRASEFMGGKRYKTYRVYDMDV